MKKIEGEIESRFVCAKCRSTGAEVKSLAMSGTGLSRLLDLQHNRYVFASCINCGFTEVYNLVYVYDPALDSWASGSPMPTNRTMVAVSVVNDIIYAMGGALDYQGDFPVGTFSFTNVVEQYSPFGYETIPHFTPEPEPFPTTLVAATSVATVIIVGAGLLVYFKKYRR